MSDVATDPGLAVTAAPDGSRLLAIVVSLVLILLAAGAALFLVRGVDNQLSDVARAQEIRNSGRELMLAVLQAESSQRGYLLSLDKAYLEPYGSAVEAIDGGYDHIVSLIADDPHRLEQIEGISDELEQKRVEMASTIQLADTGRVDEALGVLRSDAGRELMEAITSGIRAFIDQEDVRLADRNLEVQNYRQWLVAAILAALAASATLAYALFTRTQKEVSSLARTRQQLLVQTGELEEVVRARTKEAEEARAHAERERERVETLLQDTNHRIGNSLATVSSLLSLQQGRTKSQEVKAALEAAQARIQAIASAHRRLRLGADLETAQADEFLEAVIEDLRTTQPADSKVEFFTEFDPIVIKARDATTIGIVLGELITNATKHAFDAGQGGQIWTRLLHDANDVAVLTVEDNGKGLAGTSHDAGLGSMIIKQLAMQFGGEPAYSDRPGGGTRVSITLPGLNRTE